MIYIYLRKISKYNIINASIELLLKLGLDKVLGEKNILIESFKELTINDERELIFSVITVYNDLP